VVTKLNEFFSGRLAIVPLIISGHEIQSVSSIQDSLEELAWFYDLLADESSKSMLVKVLAYRLLGYRKVKLPINTPAYWSKRKSMRSLIRGKDGIKIRFPDLIINRMNLEELGYPIEAYFPVGGVMATFVLRQYEYGKRTPKIRAEEGDYVIDGGGCWGDTALYFAHAVGERGKVYTFEFTTENLAIFQRNMSLNSSIAKRIELIENALWDVSGKVINYSANGPGTSLVGDHNNDTQDSAHVTTLSIDDLVKEKKLPRVDFIKMDIEGAELSALKGAEESIRAFRPKLAIAIYHRQDDFFTIPDYLNNLNLGYEFFLDHFTIYSEETVLFASPKSD
jgi:FkbM family methyltransferase